MSIIVLKHHDENIYDVTPKEEIHIKRSPRYVSKFRESVKEEHKRNNSIRGKECGIMGPPEQQPPHPSRFLKKHTAEQARLKRNAEIKKDSESLKVSKMQPVPRTADLLKEYDKDRIQPSKNFVAENIKQVLESKPREPEQRVVIDRYGERKELSRGLEPRYINSKVFGKTPPYLVNFINIKKRQKQLQKDAEALKQPKCRYITREEREQLLAGLKQNWQELQQNYQGLPILTDTIPKILRKSKMEADLKQLEKDIVLIERHPYIYVYDDNVVAE